MTTQPRVRIDEGTVAFRGFRTWYRITRPTQMPADGADRLPLLVLHGGPGIPHDYTRPIADLLGADGRTVVHYDQLGCGRSSHPAEVPADFWTVSLFVEELRNLVDRLDVLAGGFHLLGQSWGGMLASEYVLAHPDGVRSLVLCDSPASMPLWVAGTNELLTRLPAEVQATVAAHEAAGTTDSAEYQAAVDVFYHRFLCTVDPYPADLAASLAALDADPTVYRTMIGPSEFHVTGSLRDWSVVDRLPDIRVPTLVVAGEHDEATPAAWQPFAATIPDARAHVFVGASHTPHLEVPDQFADVVGGFLRTYDALQRSN
ncbi:proline iminopeptidase-family hydrolase [Nonomuraea sp. B12E4]|uniref:proline iminopeptidase-family hydrolase n=1 Tax=Nonomuraea sp. B12E4 TaxID=3153564 RepID=UPI00325C769B